MNISEYYGTNTFNEERLKSMVSGKTYTAFKRWQDDGFAISGKQADEIAEAMKSWAISKGATSYTHWFQPMTGQTAEKHDSFITPTGPGLAIEVFSGSKLIQGEPDASSFPSGGIRATFEARGYTAWDPSSPAFVTGTETCRTLCIPSIFISYTGEALDKKLPLLRSDQALSRAAIRLLALFGVKDVKRVYSTCGPEQEYFLVDAGYFNRRPDLQLCGRTLVGAPSPKGQQLEDQYFGSIKERMLDYMNDVAREAYSLGVPLSTRHNEVAPHQYEFAPVFERSNLAADHNQLLMDIMKKTAKRHGLECLLHEKPFAGINGSGKHLNWSLADDSGANLLNPGETPEENLLFLTILVAVISAVYKHADLLRASVATAGNEHRLGANEAPPAIISVFLGKQLNAIMKNIRNGAVKKVTRSNVVDLGVSHLPRFTRDNTDRNRTSPFAFTGNKFEFRALGSALNIAMPITVLNTIVADSFTAIAEKIRKAAAGRKDFSRAVIAVLSGEIRECEPALFEGDNYSEAWEKEAARRGLPNVASSPDALDAFVKPANIGLFERHQVFGKTELTARHAIWFDLYNKIIDIEARTLLEMVGTALLPAAYRYQRDVGEGLKTLMDLAGETTAEIIDDRKDVFRKICDAAYYVHKTATRLSGMLDAALSMSEEKRARYYFSDVKEEMAHIRRHVDQLEGLMSCELWPLPKYRDMLFVA